MQLYAYDVCVTLHWNATHVISHCLYMHITQFQIQWGHWSMQKEYKKTLPTLKPLISACGSVNWWQTLMQFTQFRMGKSYFSRQLITSLQGLPPTRQQNWDNWLDGVFSSLKHNSVLLPVFNWLCRVLLPILCMSSRNMRSHCLHLGRAIYLQKEQISLTVQ